MRKYILPLLSLYLDFIWINAFVTLAHYLLGSLVESFFGGPAPWAADILVSLLLLTVLRLLNLSVGEWLLAYAQGEREAGRVKRQWPNLLLGTLGFLSGLRELARWTMPGDGVPFMGLVEDGPAKIAVLTLYGVLYGLGGIMLLRFAPRAKLVSAALLCVGVVVSAVNFLFYRDELIIAMIVRRENEGRPIELEQVEQVVASGPLYAGALFVVMAVLLYFCRERPSGNAAGPVAEKAV